MEKFMLINPKIKINKDYPTFLEQWVSGTYIVAGIFPIHASNLTIAILTKNIPSQFAEIKKSKKGFWPKGIAGFYSLPIYISDNFSDDIIAWVHSRPKYKWAMWHEPILLNSKNGKIEMFENWRRYGSAFKYYLFEIIFTALLELSEKPEKSEENFLFTINNKKMSEWGHR